MTELFDNFEVNRESRASVLLRLIGASLVVHLILLWIIIYVPAVRDTVNIAALIASTKFVNKDYVATQIGDVQIVDVEKFRYPDGYFALESQGFSNPAVAAANDPFAPKIISQWKGGGPDPEVSPSPSPGASPGISPEASPSASASPGASPSPATAQAQASASPGASASPEASPLNKEEAQKQLEQTAEKNNVTLPDQNEINKKPLKDLAVFVNDLQKQGKLDLDQPFKVVIVAELGEKGRLQNFTFLERAADPIVNDLFGRMVGALNDSGLLVYLTAIKKMNPGAKVKITLQQGENEILAAVESETMSPKDAQQLAQDFNTMLYAGVLLREGKDEGKLMKNTTATPDGNKVTVNFSMPRQSVIDMLKKQVEPGE